MKILIRICKVAVTFVITLIASSNVYSANEECPFPDVYIEIDRSYHECARGWVKRNASCYFFVDNISILFPRYNCQRSFDTGPVPAIWLFGAAAEDYHRLLYQLALGRDVKFAGKWFEEVRGKAKAIFLSNDFRSVLDGAIAEEFLPLIEEMKQNTP